MGLQIDFVPYSRVLDAALETSPESFAVAQFADDTGLCNQLASATGSATHSPVVSMGTVIAFPQYAASVSAADVHTPTRSASSVARQAIA